MSYSWRLLLVLLLCVRQETELSIAVRRFVYQKDMSEYCRRRVIPSVFLGRDVVEANSQILHFSRMELPYSCFVSIRTEAGSNIILVIQLMSDKSLVQSCKDSGSQLVVYEIGETFGGYWGPLPDHLMKPEPPEGVSYYTVRTTQTTSTSVVSSVEEREVESEKPIENMPKDFSGLPARGEALEAAGDFISVELPIVNVSAKLVPGMIQTDSLFNIDDSFDILYDVTPSAGKDYHSSVMPLVQFSVDNVVDGKRRGGGVQWSSRYQIDYDDSFTPDSRLNFLLGSTTSKRNKHRYNQYNVNRRLNFKKNKQLLAAKETPLRKKQQSTTRRAQYMQPYNIFTRHYDFVQPPKPEKEVEPDTNSWDVIEDILKNLSKTKDVKTDRPMKEEFNLLHRISDMEHNISAYLAQNLSAYKNFPTSSVQPVTKYNIDAITWSLPAVTYGSNILELLEDTKKDNVLVHDSTQTPINTIGDHATPLPVTTQSVPLDVDNIILKVANMSINVTSEISTNMVNGASETTTHKSSELLTGSLVGHESWENVVQSAPVMAIILNQSAPHDNSHGTTESSNGYQSTMTAIPTLGYVNGRLSTPFLHLFSPPTLHTLIYNTLVNSKVRKKRYVYAIPIENARPHKLPTVQEWYATTTPSYKISDAQEFAELIELQDDELHGRVALRYLRQYVGPVLFNICDYDEVTTRHVYLFNSSRLILAINNFTMERMTVVMTPAHTLLSGEARCTDAHLECQVSGARVCIDSLSACDGIPNCGSYDVYDEDRLMCGAAAGLQHNVCLAAFTFLAVLLTILYMVHYWLKRCVPRVSDAFFIYTDAAENVLYLDSIMQAPNGGDEGKSYFRSHIFQEEMQYQNVDQDKEPFFKRFITKCSKFLRCKRKKAVSREELNMMTEFYRVNPEAQRMYSFAEIEIDKMMRKNISDVAVQTGSSIEMKIRKKTSVYRIPTELRHVNEKPGTSRDVSKSRDSESSPENVSLENPYDELSMLKFLRIVRSESSRSSDLSKIYKVSAPLKNVPQIAEEEELQCLDLERSERSIQALPVEQPSTTSEIHTDKAEHVQKRLRFEDETTTIPPSVGIEFVAENDDKDDNLLRRSIVLGAAGKTYRSQDLGSIEESGEQGSREYKSYFWGGGKSKAKKTKKKSQLSPR